MNAPQVVSFDPATRTWFPSYCAVCETSAWFPSRIERNEWEMYQHQHGGAD